MVYFYLLPGYFTKAVFWINPDYKFLACKVGQISWVDGYCLQIIEMRKGGQEIIDLTWSSCSRWRRRWHHRTPSSLRWSVTSRLRKFATCQSPHSSSSHSTASCITTCSLNVSYTTQREHLLDQAWSLTQFDSVDNSHSRISVKKCVFNKRRFASAVF